MLDCPAIKNIGRSWVSSAAALATKPALLVTTAEYLAVWSAGSVDEIVKVEDVAPVIGVPLRFHWYVSDPPPAAVTLKDAGCSSMTVRLAGCAVIVGAVTTKVGVEAGVDAEDDVLLPVPSL